MLHAFYTTRELADLLGSEECQVRRLFEQNEIPEPDRFSGKRSIPESLIPAIVDGLREHNWLPQSEVFH